MNYLRYSPLDDQLKSLNLFTSRIESILCSPHTFQTLECEGYQDLKSGKLETAIEKYRAALAQTQDTQDTNKQALLRLLLGSVYNLQGQYEVAAEEYRLAADLFLKSDDFSLAIASLYSSGTILTNLGRHEKALAVHLTVFTAVKDRLQLDKESDRNFAKDLLARIVLASTQLGKPEQALRPLQEAVETFKRKGETILAGEALNWITQIYFKNPKEGLTYFSKVLESAQSQKDQYLESEVTYQMGILLYEVGDAEKSFLFQERALILCEETNNFRRAIDVLNEIGGHYQQQGKIDKALEYYERAVKQEFDLEGSLSARERLDLYRRTGQSLQLIGIIYSDLGQYRKAAEFYRHAREKSVEAGARKEGIGALGLLGVAYSELERFPEALIAFQQKQEEEKVEDVVEWQVRAFLNLSRMGGVEGNVKNVRKYLFEALVLSPQSGNPKLQALTFTETGRLYQDTSQYESSLAFYHQALNIYREAKDRKGQGEILTQLGELHLWISDNETARQWYQKAVETMRAAPDARGELRALTMLFLVDTLLGKEETASEQEQRINQLVGEVQQRIQAAQHGVPEQRSQGVDDVLELAHLYQVIGQLHALWGEKPDQAIPFLNGALQIHQQAPRTREFLKETAKDFYFLGRAYSRLRRYNEALNAFQQAEILARSLDSPEIVRLLYRKGSVLAEQGKLQEALSLYLQADEIFEHVSFQQRSEEIKIPFREGVYWFYRDIVGLLFKLHAQKPEQRYLEQAFLFEEKGKARTLLDLLEAARVRVREGIDPTLLKEEEKLNESIATIYRDLIGSSLTKDQQRQRLNILVEKEQALQTLRVRMAVTNPKYAEMSTPQVFSTQQVQAILDEETLLLEYSLGEEKSFLWGITQNDMQTYELPSESEITQHLEQYLSTLRTPLFGKDEIKRHVELGRKLYSTLLQPVSSQLREKNRLIVVPDGSLYYLPFEALIADDGKESQDGRGNDLQSLPYVIKNYTVTYTPSASVLVSLEKNRNPSHKEPIPQEPLLAFGDPLYESAPEPRTVAFNLRGGYEERNGEFRRLEYSGEEVEKIAEIYGVPLSSLSVNLREKATEKRLRELDLTRYRILHFATHAILRDEVKWITQPALVLSLNGVDDTHDGFLQMDEIFNLRLNADLVVLSACDTGKGKLHRGEGVVGLTRAFMYAGIPSVIASLWKVYDHSTSRFMEFFYRNLKAGYSKAEALRQAKLQLMQTRVQSEVLGGEQSLAAPYFWAPFVLIGRGN